MSIPVLVKIGLPLAAGALFLMGKKSSATENVGADLTTKAVQAMQKANASLLESAMNDFKKDGDDATSSLLQYQQGRMVSRGTPGFEDVPLFTDDPGLAIDNQEIVPRLIQLEGRSKALRAWAEAYQSVGATNAANDLNAKADQLDSLSSKKGNGKSSKSGKSSGKKSSSASSSGSSGSGGASSKGKASTKGNASSPDMTAVIQQVTDAIATGDVEQMRKTAADLRAHGYTEQADALDAAADELEAANKAADDAAKKQQAKDNGQPAPAPAPAPAPNPSHRTYTVKSGDSESKIAKTLTGNGNLWKDLVSINIPKDADGKSRRKVTTNDVANNPILVNRIGALYPGLQPGQTLFIPDDWKLNPSDTKPAPKPKAKPRASAPAPTPSPAGPSAPDTGDDLTTQLITMLVGKSPGQEDTFMVKKWQDANGLTSDGKYGPGGAMYMADNLGIVPPTPLYWPKSNTQKSLTSFHQEMARMALQDPTNADAYNFADQNAYQPGFEGVPLGTKIVSRRYGDGLG